MLNYLKLFYLDDSKKKQVQFNLTEVVYKTDFCIDKMVVK